MWHYRFRGRGQDCRVSSQFVDSTAKDVPGVDHVIDELVTQTPHLQTDSDGDESEQNLESPHPPDGSSKSLDILLMLINKLGREKVGPELTVSLARISLEKS